MGEKIARDYQVEGIDFLVARKRGLLMSPAGSGKTFMGATALSRVVKPGMKVCWVANTIEQVEQACNAISNTPGPDGVEFNVCCAASDPDTREVDVLITDECHHCPSVSWTAITSKVKPECVVWGLSATPFNDDEERNQQIRNLFEEMYVIERERIVASGHLALGRVIVHDLDRPGEFDEEIARATEIETRRRTRLFRRIPEWEHRRRAQWQITLDCIKTNKTRNAHICYTARSQAELGKSVLVLVQSIEHGQLLAESIPGSVLAYSKLPKKRRAQVMEDFRKGILKVMIATQVCDEGVDLPIASVMVLAAGGRASGKITQRTGRILRPFAGKEEGVVHDYADRGATYAAAQARAREAVYRSLGYAVEYRGGIQQAA